MATEARNQHWVPQCYLRGFARSPSKKAQLYVIDKAARRSFIACPRNVASARDFNRIISPEVPPDYMESRYADFEGQAAGALQRLRERRQFGDEDDFDLILNLIALLSVRNPRMRENSRSFQEKVIKLMMQESVATKERYDASLGRFAKSGASSPDDAPSYESMRDFIQGDHYSINVPTTRHVENELHQLDGLLPHLAAREWQLLRAAPDSGGYITSDHPVTLAWIEQRERGFFSSPGFGMEGTVVGFPISHDLAMWGAFDGPTGIRDLNTQAVAQINAGTIARSQRQVYARDDRFHYMLATGKMRRGDELLQDLPK